MLAEIDLVAIAPPLLVAVAALVILVGDAFAAQRAWLLQTVLSAGVLAVAGGIGWAMRDGEHVTMCTSPLPEQALERPPACGYVVDEFTVGAWVIVCLGGLLVVLLGATLARDRDLPPGEFHFLLLCSVSGALTVAAARDLASVVIALELVSLPSIALVALRHADRRAARAGWTFFLSSVVATAVTLLGVSLVYGSLGTLYYSEVGVRLAAGLSADEERVLVAGVVLTALGLFFKLGAVPFHMWVPDTYSGASVPVAAYLSVVSKAAGLAAVALFCAVMLPVAGEPLEVLVAVVAATTMTVGNIAALRQRDAVGLLAWSSVAHAGFVLAPLVAVAPATAVGPFDEGLRAALGYLAIYAIANLAAFGVVAYVRETTGSTTFESLRGLARRDRVSGIALVLATLTLAGFPPAVIGLVAKYIALRPVLAGDQQWLAVVMAVNIALGLAYYLRFIVVLVSSGDTTAVMTGSRVTRATVGLATLALVVTSVWPGAVLAVVTG